MFGLLALALIFGGAAAISDSDNSDNEIDEPHSKESRILKFNSSGYDPIKQVWWRRQDKWEIGV